MSCFVKSLAVLNFSLKKKKEFFDLFAIYNSLLAGQVITVCYFFPARDGLKRRSFTGVCLFKDNSQMYSPSITLRNSYRSNTVEVSFKIKSPLLISIEVAYWYRKKTRLARLYFIRNLRQKSFQ
jgi:ribosomal protein L19